jgi:phosphoglucomutase
MTRTRHDTSPQAQAIRAAGYVRVPGGLWATPEQLELILYMLQQNLDTINAIKERTYGAASSTYYQRHDDRS